MSDLYSALVQYGPDLWKATVDTLIMVAVTMVKELGPVLSSLMVTGRCCSAITAELGTMVVTEQVDAMRVEGTDIITRLVTPRLKATLVAMPLLALITDAISIVGGYVIAAGYGILTVENEAQALVRASPDGRDKGGEAVRACLALIALKRRFAGNRP